MAKDELAPMPGKRLLEFRTFVSVWRICEQDGVFLREPIDCPHPDMVVAYSKKWEHYLDLRVIERPSRSRPGELNWQILLINSNGDPLHTVAKERREVRQR